MTAAEVVNCGEDEAIRVTGFVLWSCSIEASEPHGGTKLRWI